MRVPEVYGHGLSASCVRWPKGNITYRPQNQEAVPRNLLQREEIPRQAGRRDGGLKGGRSFQQAERERQAVGRQRQRQWAGGGSGMCVRESVESGGQQDAED
jgi:hypothetical protein